MADMHLEKNLIQLYWGMRIGIAFIWIWTAITSWFFYPHAESISWLHRLGLTSGVDMVLAGACLLDFLIGIGALIFASNKFWNFQFVVIVLYSLAIILWLPEFLIHPFGPITKNIAVLACLAYLAVVERRRST